jgi:hypothetical protein
MNELIFSLMRFVDLKKPTMGMFFEYHDSLIEKWMQWKD